MNNQKNNQKGFPKKDDDLRQDEERFQQDGSQPQGTTPDRSQSRGQGQDSGFHSEVDEDQSDISSRSGQKRKAS